MMSVHPADLSKEVLAVQSRRLRLVIFIDHDIVYRHFVKSGVLA